MMGRADSTWEAEMDEQAPGASVALASLVPVMAGICGQDAVITDPMELATYECDGLTAHRCAPGLVVLPRTATQVRSVVQASPAPTIPFAPTATGTALPS